MKIIKSIKSYILPFIVLGIPSVAFAGSSTNFSNFKEFVDWLLRAIVTPLFIFVTGVAITLFVYGIVKYITASADESARQNGRKLMVNGVIGLFVIISFWGFVAMLRSSFGW